MTRGRSASFTFARRAVQGSPRRSGLVVAVVALVVGLGVAQAQVAAGLRSSVRGALADPSQRTVVLAAPSAAVGPVTVEEVTGTADRLRSIAGVVDAGAAVRFVDTVALGASSTTAQVGWAEPDYLRTTVPDDGRPSGVAGGGAALIPASVRDAIDPNIGAGGAPGAAGAGSWSVGGTAVADLGATPSSYLDPGLRETVLVPMGVLGPSAQFDQGSFLVAVVFDHIPGDALVRLASAAFAPDAVGDVAVVSRGRAPSAVGRIEALAGHAGRSTMVMVLGVGWLIVVALQQSTLQRRRGDLAVRMALGATRADVVTSTVVETVALGGAGGVVGVALANGTLALLAAAGHVATSPIGIGRTLLVVAAAIAATVVAAAVPVEVAARRDPADVLRSLGDT